MEAIIKPGKANSTAVARRAASHSMTSSARASSAASFVAQPLDRIEPCGAPRRVERRKEREQERHQHDRGDLALVKLGRDPGKEIDLGREQVDVQHILQEMADRLDVL